MFTLPAANPTLKRRALESSGGFENYAKVSIIPYMLGKIGYKNLGKALGPWIANGPRWRRRYRRTLGQARTNCWA